MLVMQIVLHEIAHFIQIYFYIFKFLASSSAILLARIQIDIDANSHYVLIYLHAKDI